MVAELLLEIEGESEDEPARPRVVRLALGRMGLEAPATDVHGLAANADRSTACEVGESVSSQPARHRTRLRHGLSDMRFVRSTALIEGGFRRREGEPEGMLQRRHAQGLELRRAVHSDCLESIGLASEPWQLACRRLSQQCGCIQLAMDDEDMPTRASHRRRPRASALGTIGCQLGQKPVGSDTDAQWESEPRRPREQLAGNESRSIDRPIGSLGHINERLIYGRALHDCRRGKLSECRHQGLEEVSRRSLIAAIPNAWPRPFPPICMYEAPAVPLDEGTRSVWCHMLSNSEPSSCV